MTCLKGKKVNLWALETCKGDKVHSLNLYLCFSRSFVAWLLHHHHLHPKKDGIFSQTLTGSPSGLSCAGLTSFVVWSLELPQVSV